MKKDWKPSKHVKGVLICCPAFGEQMSTRTARSIYNVGQFLTFKGIPNSFFTISAGDIEEIRNIVVTNWYDSHPALSHLLFVDADMEFEIDLVADMLSFGKPLAGCFYAKRKFPAQAVGRAFNEGSVDDIVDGFLKVAGVGGGVLLISRHVIQTMIQKMPEIVDNDVAGHPGSQAFDQKRLIRAFEKYRDNNGVKLSEDFAFCDRWLRCGGDVWANVNHLIGHVGPHNFAIRYADFLENKAAEAKQAEAA
jgi:hypothetical protein